jgi:putative addiction module killer protein
MEYNLKIYQTERGKCPFTQWLHDLSDRKAQSLIHLRLERLRMGNFGTSKSLGNGIHELKIDVGPGYRVYFSKVGAVVVLLLCAGDKKTQQKDIAKAKEYLTDYKIRIGVESYD